MKKRLLSFLTTLALCLSLLPTAALATGVPDITDTTTNITLKDTDEDGFYEIATANELRAFANLVAADNDGGETIKVKLVKDIDMSSAGSWKTIVYCGEFDGAGHTISNLTMTGTNIDKDYCAGFVYAYGATLKNVYFKSCSSIIADTVSADNDCYAAIIAPVAIMSTLENCSAIDCTVTQSGEASNFSYAGGLVGISAYGLTMNLCSVQNGSVTDNSNSNAFVAGLVGSVWDDSHEGDTTITNSFCTSPVAASGSGSWVCAGGLVGWISDDSYQMNTTLELCYISGNVSSTKYAGGLVGDDCASHLTIKNCAVLSKSISAPQGCDPFVFGEQANIGITANNFFQPPTYENLSINGSTSCTLKVDEFYGSKCVSGLCSNSETGEYTWGQQVSRLDTDAVSDYKISNFQSNLHGKLADGSSNVTITLSQDDVVKYTAVTNTDGEYNFGKQVLMGMYTLDIAADDDYPAYTTTVEIGYAENKTQDITRTANKFSVTVTNGTANPSGEQAAGTEITITADQKPGYTFTEWTGLDDSAYKSGSSKTSNPATFTMPATAVTVAATYDPAELTGMVTISGTTKYGGVLTATVTDSNNTGTLSYHWKWGSSDIDTNSQTYTLVEADIGSTITVTVTSDIQTGTITSEATSTIAKADGPAAPNVTGVKPSVLGASDGKITGTTAAMEYSTDSSFTSSYSCSEGETIGLPSGTYYVRVKATTTHEAGAYAPVTVPAGDAALTYSIGLDVSGTHTFDPANVGYGAQTVKTVTVSNTGTGATGALSVVLSGTNADAFTVSKASISSIDASSTDSFTVVPNTGLPAGTYTATVTVDGTAVDAKTFDVSFTVNATTEYIITFDGNGGTPSATSMTTTDQKLASLPAASRSGSYSFKGWFTAASGGTQITTAYTFNSDTTVYAQWTYSGSSSSGGASSNTSTTTEKNPDGSTTTTVTDKTTGTVTETTKNTDGSTNVVETKKDGTVTETNKSADGTTGTVVTDKNGDITDVSASVSSEAANQAAKTGDTVTLPVEVPAAKSTEDALIVEITVPKSAGPVKVEIPVENVTPGTVAVIVKADGTEEIISTSVPTENGVVLTLDGNATVKVINNAREFSDVPATSWASDAVAFASARGITDGIDDTHFAPNAPCTRAQIVTFLWRAAGCPEPENLSNFSDVSADAYYAKAVAWALENGITGGIGNGMFSPDATCTRSQSVTFLYRAAGSPTASEDSAFRDVTSESYYAAAVAWAAQNGITSGIGSGLFGPANECSRAQIVTFLYRWLVK